jgi:hypothetical protein
MDTEDFLDLNDTVQIEDKEYTEEEEAKMGAINDRYTTMFTAWGIQSASHSGL